MTMAIESETTPMIVKWISIPERIGPIPVDVTARPAELTASDILNSVFEEAIGWEDAEWQ